MMSQLLTLSLLGLITFLSSCASQKTDCSACEKLYNSVQTAKQGAAKARSDIRESGYAIYRYDMPGIRTGWWGPYHARFEHFGIKEYGGSFGLASLAYMQSYNKVMDTSLKQKYGSEYRKYRHKIMPPKGAKIYSYSNQSNQAKNTR